MCIFLFVIPQFFSTALHRNELDWGSLYFVNKYEIYMCLSVINNYFFNCAMVYFSRYRIASIRFNTGGCE